MARKRMIHPEFFLSDDVAVLSVPARLTFVGLWCYVDDDGRGKDSAAAVRSFVWGMDSDVTPSKVAKWLDELVIVESLCRYSVDGAQYLHVRAWDRWQSISHPSVPRLPACPEHGGRPIGEPRRRKSSVSLRNPPESLRNSPQSAPQVVSAVEVRELGQVVSARGGGECSHGDPHPEMCRLCARGLRSVG